MKNPRKELFNLLLPDHYEAAIALYKYNPDVALQRVREIKRQARHRTLEKLLAKVRKKAA